MFLPVDFFSGHKYIFMEKNTYVKIEKIKFPVDFIALFLNEKQSGEAMARNYFPMKCFPMLQLFWCKIKGD